MPRETRKQLHLLPLIFLFLLSSIYFPSTTVAQPNDPFSWKYVQKRTYEGGGQLNRLGFGLHDQSSGNIKSVQLTDPDGKTVNLYTPRGNLLGSNATGDTSWFMDGYFYIFGWYEAHRSSYNYREYSLHNDYFLNLYDATLTNGTYTINATKDDETEIIGNFTYRDYDLPVVNEDSINCDFDAQHNLTCTWKLNKELPSNAGVNVRPTLNIYNKQEEWKTYMQAKAPPFLNSCTFPKDKLMEMMRFGSNATFRVQLNSKEGSVRTYSKPVKIDFSQLPSPEFLDEYQIADWSYLQRRIDSNNNESHYLLVALQNASGEYAQTNILAPIYENIKLENPDGDPISIDWQESNFLTMDNVYNGQYASNKLNLSDSSQESFYIVKLAQQLQPGKYSLTLTDPLGNKLVKDFEYSGDQSLAEPYWLEYSFDSSKNLTISWHVNQDTGSMPEGGSAQILNLDFYDEDDPNWNWQGDGYAWISMSGNKRQVTLPASFVKKLWQRNLKFKAKIIIRSADSNNRRSSESIQIYPAQAFVGDLSFAVQNRQAPYYAEYNQLYLDYTNMFNKMPDSNSLEEIRLYGPDGQLIPEVNASVAELETERYLWGWYDDGIQDFRFTEKIGFFSWYDFKFNQNRSLQPGTYRLELKDAHADYKYEDEYRVSGLTEKLPIVDNSTIDVNLESGNFTAEWQNPPLYPGLDPNEDFRVTTMISAYKNGNYVASIYVTPPWHLKHVQIPAEKLKWLKGMGDRFEFCVRLRTRNSIHTTYSGPVSVDLSEISSPSAAEYTRQAENYLFSETFEEDQENLVTANELLNKAVQRDPDNPIANAYLALTSLGTWSINYNVDHPGYLLQQLGLQTSFDENHELLFNFPHNKEGQLTLPENAPTGEEIRQLIQNGLLEQINVSLDYAFKAVTNWNGPYVISTDAENLEVDKSDIELLQAGLKALKGWANLLTAYDIGVDLHSLVDKINSQDIILRHYLKDNPDLLTLVDNGATKLSLAKSLFVEAITEYISAMHVILEDDAPTNPDADEEFIFIPSGEGKEEARFLNQELNKIKTALNNPDQNYTMNFIDHDWQLTGEFGENHAMLWYDLYNGEVMDGEFETVSYTGEFICWDAGVQNVQFNGFEPGNKIGFELEFYNHWGYPNTAVLNGTLDNQFQDWTISGDYSVYNGTNPQANLISTGSFSGTLLDKNREEIRLNPSPLFGSGAGPYNLRDFLPKFHLDNEPIFDTIGHGLGNDAQLGGLLPDFTQKEWIEVLDLQQKITLRDAVGIMQILCGFSQQKPLSDWDINNNGHLDISEAIFALQYVSGQK